MIKNKSKEIQIISKTKEEIIQDIHDATTIMLTGDVCCYEDPKDRTDLISLLQYIVENSKAINIHLQSVNPTYTKIFKLIDFIEQEPKMCKELNLTTISGSNRILNQQNKKYNRLRLTAIITHAKNLKINQELVVDFPDETEEDFNETLNLLKSTYVKDVQNNIRPFQQNQTQHYNKLLAHIEKIDEIINQKLRCIQFELWHNCTNECDFCYLNGCRKFYADKQKQDSIQKVLEILDSDKIQGFNAVGLIGGELFMDQQGDRDTQDKFEELAKKIKDFLVQDQFREVWLTSNLLSENLGPLIGVLDILLKDLPKYQRVLLCTSYDTEGRFRSKEKYELWYNNLKKLRGMFPRLCLHIETICTQAFVDEWLDDNSKFVDFIDKGFMMDFKPPATSAVDFIYNNTGRESYRKNLEKLAETQNYKYLIDSRDKFIKFWESVAKTFPNGVQKLKDFNSNEVKSECCYSIPWNEWFENRWESKKENAPCGHCWDGYCYKDYPDRCAKCDVENLIKMMEKG